MARFLPRSLPRRLSAGRPITVVDIGHRWTRMARYSSDLTMLGHAHAPTPEGAVHAGVIFDPGAISITLSGLVRDLGLRDREVAVSYTDPELGISPLTIPRLKTKDLHLSGGYYIEDQLLISPDDTAFDILYPPARHSEALPAADDTDYPIDTEEESAVAVHAPRDHILSLLTAITAANLVPTHVIPLITALPLATPNPATPTVIIHIGGHHLQLATCTEDGFLSYARNSTDLRLVDVIEPGQQPQFLSDLAQEVSATVLHVETSEGIAITDMIVTGPGARIPHLPDRLAMECDLNLAATLDYTPVNPAPLNPAANTPNQPDYMASHFTAAAIHDLRTQSRKRPNLAIPKLRPGKRNQEK